MKDTYGPKYWSLGSLFDVNLERPTVKVITGRGSSTIVENRRGAMAVVTVAMGRILMGKIQTPYDGFQEFHVFELTATAMKLINIIGAEHYNGNVSNVILYRL